MLKSLKNRGAALISSLMVLLILGMICGGFVIIITSDKRWAERETMHYHLLYTALAGLEYGKWLIKHNLGYYPAHYYHYNIYNKGGLVGAQTACPGNMYNLYGTSDIITGWAPYRDSGTGAVGNGTIGVYCGVNDTITNGLDYGSDTTDDGGVRFGGRRYAEHVFISDHSFTSEASTIGVGESGNYDGFNTALTPTTSGVFTSGNYSTGYSGNSNPLHSKRQIATFVLALRQVRNHVFNCTSHDGGPNCIHSINSSNSGANRQYAELVSTARIWQLPSYFNMSQEAVEKGGSFYNKGARVIGLRSVKCEFMYGSLDEGYTSSLTDPIWGAVSKPFSHHRELLR